MLAISHIGSDPCISARQEVDLKKENNLEPVTRNGWLLKSLCLLLVSPENFFHLFTLKHQLPE
jgi:hypothetical protein